MRVLWMRGVHHAAASNLFREVQANAGTEENIVLLAAGDGITQVPVANGHLPGKPTPDSRNRRSVEIHTKSACIGHVREERESLFDGGCTGEFMTQVFAKQDFGRC